MFKNMAIRKITEAADTFGAEFGRELNRTTPSQQTRDDLAQVFEAALRGTAHRLGTDTAHEAVGVILTRVRGWLGAR